MPHANTRTTLVRRAVARFEPPSATPTLASSAVAAANAADSSAHPIQLPIQFVVQLMAIRIRAAHDFSANSVSQGEPASSPKHPVLSSLRPLQPKHRRSLLKNSLIPMGTSNAVLRLILPAVLIGGMV